jgi:3-isopropylmalate/(R)-2-methylmalate dehydratase small subunit
VQVSEDFLDKLFQAADGDPSARVRVDLEKQQITLLTTGETESFEINAYKKECLLNGYDDIDYLISLKDKIEQFEESRS